MGVKYFYKVYCRIHWGQGASCSGYREDKDFYKVHCRIDWAEGASCPGNSGLNIYIMCILEYAGGKGIHALEIRIYFSFT